MVNEKWTKYKLGEIATFRKGSGIRRDQSQSGILPAVRYGELYTTHSNYIKRYTSSISKSVALKAAKATYGDILFAGTGETKEEIGKCAAIIDKVDVYIGGDVIIMTPRIPTHPVFLGSMLNAPYVQLQRAEKGQGDAVVHISASSLAETYVFLPPFDEQCTIADVFLSIDKLIADLEKLIEKKRAIKQGAMQELLTGKRRLPGFTGEWKKRTLGEYIYCIRGVSYDGSRDVFSAERDDTIRLLRSNNIQQATFYNKDIQFVRRSKAKNTQLIQKNDIMVCMANGSKALVGKNCIFGKDMHNKYTFGAFMSVVRALSEDVNMYYIFNLMNSGAYWDNIALLFSGSSINNLRPSDILGMEFLMPSSNNEMSAISSILNDMDGEIALAEEKLEKYRAIKQGMMQKLLTGEIRLV